MSAFTGRMTLAAARRAFQQQRSIHAATPGHQPKEAVRNNLSLLPEDMDAVKKEFIAYDIEVVKRDLKIRAFDYNARTADYVPQGWLFGWNTIAIFFASMSFGLVTSRNRLNQMPKSS